MRMIRAYKPHTSPPPRQQLLQAKYELEGHCTLQGIAEQQGIVLKGKTQ